MTWQEKVKSAGGRCRNRISPIIHDGKEYEYESVWNEPEEIEAFMETHGDNISKSDTDMVEAYLTFFFSTKVDS